MDVDVKRTAEALDQRHRASACGLASESGPMDQVAGDHTIDDAEHLAHDRWAAGEQEMQRIRKTRRSYKLYNRAKNRNQLSVHFGGKQQTWALGYRYRKWLFHRIRIS